MLIGKFICVFWVGGGGFEDVVEDCLSIEMLFIENSKKVNIVMIWGCIFRG